MSQEAIITETKELQLLPFKRARETQTRYSFTENESTRTVEFSTEPRNYKVLRVNAESSQNCIVQFCEALQLSVDLDPSIGIFPDQSEVIKEGFLTGLKVMEDFQNKFVNGYSHNNDGELAEFLTISDMFAPAAGCQLETWLASIDLEQRQHSFDYIFEVVNSKAKSVPFFTELTNTDVLCKLNIPLNVQGAYKNGFAFAMCLALDSFDKTYNEIAAQNSSD